MLRQLDVANHYQVLLRFYYDKLNIKQHRKQICRKRHDLVHDQGKFFYCPLFDRPCGSGCAGCAAAHPIIAFFLSKDSNLVPKSWIFILICTPNV